ncbi:MAG: diguanylate cyclase [Spirochaetales bacterium]|nr:diguanylate cyclase [Spirochaetales bacterium]
MSDSGKDPHIYTLIIISLLFSLFIGANYYTGKTTLFFMVIQLFSVSWIFLIVYVNRISVLTVIPVSIVTPLLILQLSTLNSLALYHIILAVFSIQFLLISPQGLQGKLTLYLSLLVSYCLAGYLHQTFTALDLAIHGGILTHLLILITGYLSLERDELKKENESLRTELLNLKNDWSDEEQDPLMGIFSKSGGMRVLKQTMKWSQRYKIPLTVCYMEVNNSRDDYIHSITRRIVNRVRESDTLFRLGKSEILLVLPDCCKNDAALVMESIQKILQDDSETEAVQFGLADFKADVRTSPNELIISANMAIA